MKTKKFDYMEFNNDSWVFDSETYSKEEALEIFKSEAERDEDYKVDDVKEDYVAFRLGINKSLFPNGAYWLGMKGKRGAFKVWVIE